MTPSRLETARRRIGGDNPLLRNGYALVLNVGLTSGLGVTFWVIAAREYTVEDVGRGSAMVSARPIDLSPVASLPLRRLKISGMVTKVDLAGLDGARLRSLSLSGGVLLDDPTTGNECEYHDHEDGPHCNLKGKGKGKQGD